MEYIVTPIRLSIAKELGDNTRYEITSLLRMDETGGILKASKNVDRIIELLDFISNEKCTIMQGHGIEGVDYNWIDGKIIMTPEFLAGATGSDASFNGSEFVSSRGLYRGYAFLPTRRNAQLPNGQAGFYMNDAEYLNLSASDRQKEAYSALGWANLTSGWTDSPHFDFVPFDISKYTTAIASFDPESDESIAITKIDEYLYAQIPFLINAPTVDEFERLYAEVLSTIDGMGIEGLLVECNARLK
jgi:hypothetical protein